MIFLNSFSESPYRASSTTKVVKSDTAAVKKPTPWPRTRVGDFVLVFPLTEAQRKASQPSNYDMKTIIKEGNKIHKKIIDKAEQRKEEAASSTNASKSDEAINFDFQLKLDDKDSNPLYLWGPQTPPLLSQVIS